jgi:hypothetical protein
MRKAEVSHLLTVMAMMDKRQKTTDEDVMLWAEILPEELTLELALAAVKAFYAAPAEQFEPVLTTRQLMRFVRAVKQDRTREQLRRNAREATRVAPELEERRRNLRAIGGLGAQLKHPDDH